MIRHHLHLRIRPLHWTLGYCTLKPYVRQVVINSHYKIPISIHIMVSLGLLQPILQWRQPTNQSIGNYTRPLVLFFFGFHNVPYVNVNVWIMLIPFCAIQYLLSITIKMLYHFYDTFLLTHCRSSNESNGLGRWDHHKTLQSHVFCVLCPIHADCNISIATDEWVFSLHSINIDMVTT